MHSDHKNPRSWQSPEVCLILMAAAAPFSFAIWMALLNNFTVEVAGFEGKEIGMLQSIREIPGFLAFTAIFVLLILREQAFALISLMVLGLFVGITGYFPSEYALYATTLMMSIGYHYYETMQMSLTLQWISKDKAPKTMGQQISARSVASIMAYALLWFAAKYTSIPYEILFAIGGGVTVVIAIFIWLAFPRIEAHEAQHKKLILRKRYWLFYALTFMGGARRQIFVVFAGFLLVTKFDFSVENISGLLFVNYIITSWFAPKVGAYIIKWGERRTLIIEYIGLVFVFLGYAITEDVQVATVLYVIDHLFFSFAIAHKSYLQKIADSKDIAATSSVSFSINHIAAVFIPVLFGVYLWPVSPSLVFYAGAAMAFVSLLLSLNVPRHPKEGSEVNWGYTSSLQAAE